MLKKILSVLILLILCTATTFADETYTLKAGVSMVDKVPKEFYGTWRVSSVRVDTNNEEIFRESTTDLWNLSKSGNVITLENPFTGARASITVDSVQNKLIKFKKNGDFDSKKLTDIVQLQLKGDSFSGTNVLILKTLSSVDNSVIKTERATYKLSGEKISGASIK